MSTRTFGTTANPRGNCLWSLFISSMSLSFHIRESESLCAASASLPAQKFLQCFKCTRLDGPFWLSQVKWLRKLHVLKHWTTNCEHKKSLIDKSNVWEALWTMGLVHTAYSLIHWRISSRFNSFYIGVSHESSGAQMGVRFILKSYGDSSEIFISQVKMNFRNKAQGPNL